MVVLNGLEMSAMFDKKYGPGVTNVFSVGGRPVRSRFSPDDMFVVGTRGEVGRYGNKIRSVLTGANVH